MTSSTGTFPAAPRASDSQRSDWGAALLAYAIWGLFPLFWRLFGETPVFEIVIQRTVWSAIFLAAVLAAFRGESLGRNLREGWAKRRILIPSALLIGTNWLVYVWAVANGRVLEASLGYFICPFIQILLGALFHRERVSRPVGVAIGVSLAGVAWIAWVSGLAQFPWVALILSTSFALYGSIKKTSGVPAVQGAFFESVLLGIPALVFVLAHGLGPEAAPVFYAEPYFWFLSVLGGALTAFPLILYSAAASRLPLASLGFLQFLNPTIQFALAVTLFGESLQPEKIGGFVLIWAGVAIYLAAKTLPRRQCSVAPIGTGASRDASGSGIISTLSRADLS